MEIKNVGICGLGMVGGSMKRYFINKKDIKIFGYDKNKNEGSLEELNKADVIFVCVPTPWDGKHFDTGIVEKAISYLEGNKIVVIKSTISIGTTKKLQEKFPQHILLFNPEFLTEATADQDMAYPDRQIIGYCDDRGYKISKDILNILPLAQYEGVVPAEQAEAVKLFGNSWFAMKVAINNQFHDIWEDLGYDKEDYQKVADMMAMDKRVGRTHLTVWHKNYRGYGGKCLMKDTKCAIEQGGEKASILKVADKYNDELQKKQSKS